MEKRWLEFFKQWHDSIPVDIFAQYAAVDSISSKWQDSDGAKHPQITATETRLGVNLPPSYRAFLQASNGLVVPGSILPRLLAVEEIDWLRVLDPEAISAWKLGMSLHGPLQPVSDEEYFVYGEGQDPSSLRSEYLEAALQISDKESADIAIYLLNPKVIDEDGEWEAWSFAHWKGGADRYRSFWDLMQAEYHSFLSVAEQEAKRLQPSDDAGALIVKLADLIGELQEKAAVWENMVERNNEMGNNLGLGYHQGILEGLQYAERRVDEIGTREANPEKLHAQLKALENELKEKWLAGVEAVQGGSIMRNLLSGGANQIVHLSGTAEGYREAWGIINWFLHEG